MIKFKKEENGEMCDICYIKINEMENKFITDDLIESGLVVKYNKYNNYMLNDYLMSFKCCKYNNKICKKCFIIYYNTLFKNQIHSVFNNFNCVFCTQKIYILQLKPEFIRILVNN